MVKPPGGRPGAGYLLLRGQKKLTEEKAALVSLRLRVPCVTQRVRGLRNSLSNSERTHKNVRELRQSSPSAPDSDSRRVEREGAPGLRSNSVDRSFIVRSRTGATRHRVAANRPRLRYSAVHKGLISEQHRDASSGADVKSNQSLCLRCLRPYSMSDHDAASPWGPLVRRRAVAAVKRAVGEDLSELAILECLTR